MDHLPRSEQKYGISHTKTSATSDKKTVTLRPESSPNPQMIWQHKQEKSQTSLLSECYEIIKQQEAHIEKLEKDNNRKDSIIANLLNKNTHLHKKYDNTHIATLPQLSELERLSKEMLELYNKYEKVTSQNQLYKVQLVGKEQQIKELQKINKSMAEKEMQMQNEIEEVKNTMNKLKQAYETKIAKLLGQMRRKIEEDVQKSMQKRTITENSEQKSTFTKSPIINSPHQQEKKTQSQNVPLNLYTPSKITKDYQGERKIETYDSQENQKLPYGVVAQKITRNFIPTSFKSFPTAIQTANLSRGQSNDNNNNQRSQRKAGRILEQMRDVEFITDSYGDTSIDSYSDFGIASNQIENKNMGKISINKFVNQYQQYFNKEKTSGKQNGTNMRVIESERMWSSRKGSELKKIKIVQFLEQLNQRVRRYEKLEPEQY